VVWPLITINREVRLNNNNIASTEEILELLLLLLRKVLLLGVGKEREGTREDLGDGCGDGALRCVGVCVGMAVGAAGVVLRCVCVCVDTAVGAAGVTRAAEETTGFWTALRRLREEEGEKTLLGERLAEEIALTRSATLRGHMSSW